MSTPATPREINDFWIEAGPEAWFNTDADFDAEIRARFEDAHMAAARRELDSWIESPEPALALLLLLDQFPRNMYRDTAHAFATDPVARLLAGRACSAGLDRQVEPALAKFFHLPFEHSERLEDQERAIALVTATSDEDDLKWARTHHEIIVRFGRFPHRNAALGRETTAEEQAFLDSGGFSG